MRHPILLALVSTLATVSNVIATHANLESLCSNKAIDLKRSSQIKSLVVELKRGAPECPKHVQSALKDLDDLINSSNGNVCSLEAVDEVHEYYEEYISPGLDDKDARLLPEPLKNFVLAYGLQVSKLCKTNMIRSLRLGSKYRLKQEDHKLVEPWTGEHSLISKLMSESIDHNDLLLPHDVNRALESAYNMGNTAATAGDGKMYVEKSVGQVIKKMQAICDHRFEPIYEQLILPLIYLSNMGFDYHSKELDLDLNNPTMNKEIHQWYQIVYLCEPLLNIEIVGDPKDAEITRGTDERLVRILNKEDAAKIEAQLEDAPDGVGEEIELNGIDQFDYKSNHDTRIDDEVVDPSDTSLTELVNEFTNHVSRLQGIRSRLVGKLVGFMKDGSLDVLGALMGGKTSTKQRNGHEVITANNEIVNAIDKYIVGRNPTFDGSVSQMIESIQLGIAVATINLASKPEKDISLNDFTMVETVRFPKTGSETTPPHQYNQFKFKTYAPIAYRRFRALFGIGTNDYLSSVGSAQNRLRELSNPGASGSGFYLSHDDKFIIKTVHPKEERFLLKMLPEYYMNLQRNPRTLLPKFFGQYGYVSKGKKSRLIVMDNLLPSSITIDQKYDLKGSTFKRKASNRERSKALPTFKDLDFMEHHEQGFTLEPAIYDELMKTIASDLKFLESFKIMDFSLLVGVHNLVKHSNGTPMKPLSIKILKETNSWRAIPAKNSNGENVLLFVGIIDILQSYRLKKKLEHTFKSMLYDGDSISVHKPSFYCKRFEKFLATKVFRRAAPSARALGTLFKNQDP